MPQSESDGLFELASTLHKQATDLEAMASNLRDKAEEMVKNARRIQREEAENET